MFRLLKRALWVIIAMAVSAAASDYEVQFVGPDVIEVDGSLDEWNDLAVRKQPIGLFPSRVLHSENGDNGAVFNAAADREYLYFAISVSDGDKIFGGTFSKTRQQDCIELHMDTGSDTNSRRIRVSASSDGRTAEIDGVYGVGESSIHLPLLYEALGVRAAIQQRADGYDVELRIPAEVLNHNSFNDAARLRMNVLVVDVDKARNLRVSSWNPHYNFSNTIDPKSLSDVRLIGGEEVARSAHSKLEAGSLVIFPLTPTDRLLDTAIDQIAQQDWESAVPALERTLENSEVPTVRAFAAYVLADHALQQNRRSDAIGRYEAWMMEDPVQYGLSDRTFGIVSIHLAKSYWNIGRHSDARPLPYLVTDVLYPDRPNRKRTSRL